MKLYIPPLRPNAVRRPRLIERLNEGVYRKLTLISAPAGFGKTTLVSEWINQIDDRVAWLSLDEDDSDPIRFLLYLITALQTLTLSDVDGIEPSLGETSLAMLQSPQSPATASILTNLLNEITAVSHKFILVLDDYHLVDNQSVDDAMAFLLQHLPPQLHLVIATRDTPPFHLARYRARGQLTELRGNDLRFTSNEVAKFLNQAMGLMLSTEEITALESRTEGWIAGLQLAALSMQGQDDTTTFIDTFTGSHRFVLDYLMGEVLQQQPQNIQTFLLRTSILDRLCGSLCEAVLLNSEASGQETLEALEQANLFIIPLDNERRWYRYHHLFADLLRQRLQQTEEEEADELHRRASQWYEDNDLEIEAFHHAAKANDIGGARTIA